MEQITTYQYRARDGREIWLPFDPEFPCIYCQEPVKSMSSGGPAVCGRCDCGRNAEGKKWGGNEASALYKRAWDRLDAIADSGLHSSPKLLTPARYHTVER